MYELLALLCGVTLAVMVCANGNLTAACGVFPAAAIVHIAGSLAAFCLCALQKKKTPLWGRGPVWIYLGGAVGVLTTVFTNLAYGRISMTSIIALGLLGQSVAALTVDGLGLLGMQKQPLQRAALPGLVFSLLGILFMLDNTVSMAGAAVWASLGAGISVVLSRTLNARLAQRIGALRGSFVNHLVGLPITLLLAAASLGRGGPLFTSRPPLFAYLGGVLGVGAVLLSNRIVPRLPAFRLTLFTFASQILTGVVIDALLGNAFSDATFTGGLLVAVGVLLSVVMERLQADKARQEALYWARIEATAQAHREHICEKYGKAEK